jgi:hypothetical protein
MLRNFAEGSKILPLSAIALGFLLLLFFALRHLPENTRALMLHVEHPTSYRFTAYDNLLKKYVKDGLVDYARLREDPELKTAIDSLERTAGDKMTDEKESASFWINANNLLTLKVICDHYPITNTDQISQFWSQQPFIIGGETTAVSRVYERAMNQLDDRRLPASSVFLICRGSLGYPPLTDHAITPETFEADAKLAAYKFVNNEHNAYYNDERLEFLLSPLFKRYERILNRSNFDTHTFAVMQMSGKNVPDITNIMITKTYFPKINPTLNDTALSPRKENE